MKFLLLTQDHMEMGIKTVPVPNFPPISTMVNTQDLIFTFLTIV